MEHTAEYGIARADFTGHAGVLAIRATIQGRGIRFLSEACLSVMSSRTLKMISLNYNYNGPAPFKKIPDLTLIVTPHPMSLSPPIRRYSTASSGSSSKREEDLINAYEAEEERIINVLSRKLEKVGHLGVTLPIQIHANPILSSRKRRSSSKTCSRQNQSRTLTVSLASSRRCVSHSKLHPSKMEDLPE